MTTRKMIYSLVIVTMLSLVMAACQPGGEGESKQVKDGPVPQPAAREKERYDDTFFDLFNTVTQVLMYAQDEKEFVAYSQAMQAEMETYHQLFDIYNSYQGVTNLYTLNQEAAKGPVKVDPRLFDFLQYCKDMYKQTNGRVNIAFGSVLQIWHLYREAGLEEPALAKVPTKEELEEASHHTDINQLILDEEKQTVYYADPNLKLDVGAIAKGYSVQKVIESAKQAGFEAGLISAGGNVTTLGLKPNHQKWQVGIQNPDMTASESILQVLEITNQSLVSSGDYERYYQVDGQSYHHIIDPDTLYPARYFHQVSILTEDSALADALSTAVFLMPLGEGKAFIESLDGVEAMWVLADFQIEMTSGMGQYIMK